MSMNPVPRPTAACTRCWRATAAVGLVGAVVRAGATGQGQGGWEWFGCGAASGGCYSERYTNGADEQARRCTAADAVELGEGLVGLSLVTLRWCRGNLRRPQGLQGNSGPEQTCRISL